MIMNPIDILVSNGTVLTMDPDGRQIKNGAVAIKEEKIISVGPADDFSTWRASRVIDADGGIIMPGLVNTHTHLPMSLFRGLADDLPLMTWLNDYIFPAERKHITPESVRLGAFLSCAEMIMSGTTTCCDGYFFENEVAQAVYEIGMRAVLAQGVIDFPAPGVPDPKDNISNAVRFVEKWEGACSTITPSIFCHSPYTCSEKTLKEAKTATDAKELLFQIHAAETKNEWEETHSRHQTTPVKYLDRVGIIDRRTLLVHCIWVDEDDTDMLAGRCAAVSHTPESNMKLASGIAPIPRLLKSGITVGLGTDGCASNNNLDLFQEMDTAAKLHKVNMLDPSVMSAHEVLKMATIGGAKTIGLDNEIGSLEAGKQADLIIVETKKPHLIPMYNPVSHLVYAALGSDVRDVIVAGKVLLANKKLMTLELDRVLEEAAAVADLVGKGFSILD